MKLIHHKSIINFKIKWIINLSLIIIIIIQELHLYNQQTIYKTKNIIDLTAILIDIKISFKIFIKLLYSFFKLTIYYKFYIVYIKMINFIY